MVPMSDSRQTPEPGGETPRTYHQEMVDGIAVVPLYADAFQALPRKQRILAYHLTRAALAGRDIAFDQNHRQALEIRQLLEEIDLHRRGIPGALQEEIRDYLQLLWIHGSQYHQRTRQKFVPRFSFRQLRQAARQARKNGARFPAAAGLDLDAYLRTLVPAVFDPAFESLAIDKNPPPGQDLLTASANNFYSGITLREADSFPERNPLNSRLVKSGDEIREEVYRTGGDGTPAGRYARELAGVIEHLKKALPLADEAQRNSLEPLIDYFRTGDPEAFRRHSIAWLKTDSAVDLIIGFIEVYRDPRGLKGAFEGIVFVTDPHTTGLLRQLAEEAAYFEANAPWGNKYRKKEIQPQVAKAVQVLLATGDGGPMCPTGINLPNAQEIRQTHGSKSVLISNVLDSLEHSSGKQVIEEFALPEERSRARTLGPLVERLQTAMHEVLGHASGKVAEELAGDPAEYLKEYYSTLEEARAELVALWYFGDSKLVEMGILPEGEATRAAYERYARLGLYQLRRIPRGDRLTDDHMRATHLITTHLMENSGAIQAVERDGKVYLTVPDTGRMRQGVGKLLAQIMRIKGEGDYQGARDLVERYGVLFPSEWRDQVVERSRSAGIADFTAFVMPELIPIRGDDGGIVDVRISSMPVAFFSQQMGFSGKEVAGEAVEP